VILDAYWPEFSRNHLYEAIKSFQKRERRFGKVSEQVENNKDISNVQNLPAEIV